MVSLPPNSFSYLKFGVMKLPGKNGIPQREKQGRAFVPSSAVCRKRIDHFKFHLNANSFKVRHAKILRSKNH